MSAVAANAHDTVDAFCCFGRLYRPVEQTSTLKQPCFGPARLYYQQQTSMWTSLVALRRFKPSNLRWIVLIRCCFFFAIFLSHPPTHSHSVVRNMTSKKKQPKYKKAPQAPRRFKSSYMFFSTFKHKEIRKELNEEAGDTKVRQKLTYGTHQLSFNVGTGCCSYVSHGSHSAYP